MSVRPSLRNSITPLPFLARGPPAAASCVGYPNLLVFDADQLGEPKEAKEDTKGYGNGFEKIVHNVNEIEAK